VHAQSTKTLLCYTKMKAIVGNGLYRLRPPEKKTQTTKEKLFLTVPGVITKDMGKKANAEKKNTIKYLRSGKKERALTLKAVETKYQCDNCKRVTYIQQGRSPSGWYSLKLWNDENEPDNTQDICDSCSQAVLQCLGRRKGIERGRHFEKPLQEHLKSPQACDNQSKIFAARMASSTTD